MKITFVVGGVAVQRGVGALRHGGHRFSARSPITTLLITRRAGPLRDPDEESPMAVMAVDLAGLLSSSQFLAGGRAAAPPKNPSPGCRTGAALMFQCNTEAAGLQECKEKG